MVFDINYVSLFNNVYTSSQLNSSGKNNITIQTECLNFSPLTSQNLRYIRNIVLTIN